VRTSRGTIIVSSADHRQKGICSQLWEEEDEIQASDMQSGSSGLLHHELAGDMLLQMQSFQLLTALWKSRALH